MRHWHGNALDATSVLGRRGCTGVVGGDLVTEEVEVHPAFGTAAFPAAQYLAVKAPGRIEVAHEEGEVKWLRHSRKHEALEYVPQPES